MLSGPYLENDHWILDLNTATSDETLASLVAILENDFAASCGESVDGPGATILSLTIERQEFSLVLSDVAGVSLKTKSKNGKMVLERLAASWPSE